MSQHGHGQDYTGVLSRGVRGALAAALLFAACGKTSGGGEPIGPDATMGGVPAFEAGGQRSAAPVGAAPMGGQPRPIEDPGVAGEASAGGRRSSDGGAPSQAGAGGRGDAGDGGHANEGGSPGDGCGTFVELWTDYRCDAFTEDASPCSGLCIDHLGPCECAECSDDEGGEPCRRLYLACRAACARARAACVKYDCPVWQQRCTELAEQYPECAAR